MFVYIVWNRAEIVKPKRNRRPHKSGKTVIVDQDKPKQDYLSQLKAKRWDTENDYRIYRIPVDNRKAGIQGLLAQMAIDCERLGLSGPYVPQREQNGKIGFGRIGWQGQGGGAQKNVSASIARKAGEDYLRAKLDLLAQIRVLAGYQSQFEVWNLPDISIEMREKWTALLTPELDRWLQYLASKESPVYDSALRLTKTFEQQEAFIGERIGFGGVQMPEKISLKVSKPGKVSPTQKESFAQMRSDLTALPIDSKLDSALSAMPVKMIETPAQQVCDLDMYGRPIYRPIGETVPLI